MLGIAVEGSPRPQARDMLLSRVWCNLDAVTFSLDEARTFIKDVRWQFARTMPQWPHEYTVRGWREDLDESFAAFVDLMRRDGTVKPWPRDAARPRYHHAYLEIDGWEYWTMGEPIAETTVINRARLEADAAAAPS